MLHKQTHVKMKWTHFTRAPSDFRRPRFKQGSGEVDRLKMVDINKILPIKHSGIAPSSYWWSVFPALWEIKI